MDKLIFALENIEKVLTQISETLIAMKDGQQQSFDMAKKAQTDIPKRVQEAMATVQHLMRPGGR